MDYQQAINRLINHANISDKIDLPEEESLVYHLWISTISGMEPTIAPLRKDVIRCLQEINLQINGSTPSDTITSIRSVDEELVIIVSDLIHSCIDFYATWTKRGLFDEQTRWELQITAWMISYAWGAILAGDIDDIEQEMNYALEVKEIV